VNILEEAASIVSGARNADYGTPLDNHQRTADLWSAYLGVTVSPRMVCMMNVLQKVSRDAHAPKRDNLVDIAGYARNAELCKAPVPDLGEPPVEKWRTLTPEDEQRIAAFWKQHPSNPECLHEYRLAKNTQIGDVIYCMRCQPRVGEIPDHNWWFHDGDVAMDKAIAAAEREAKDLREAGLASGEDGA
jgi:hypothetical protein